MNNTKMNISKRKEEVLERAEIVIDDYLSGKYNLEPEAEEFLTNTLKKC